MECRAAGLGSRGLGVTGRETSSQALPGSSTPLDTSCPSSPVSGSTSRGALNSVRMVMVAPGSMLAWYSVSAYNSGFPFPHLVPHTEEVALLS